MFPCPGSRLDGTLVVGSERSTYWSWTIRSKPGKLVGTIRNIGFTFLLELEQLAYYDARAADDCLTSTRKEIKFENKKQENSLKEGERDSQAWLVSASIPSGLQTVFSWDFPVTGINEFPVSFSCYDSEAGQISAQPEDSYIGFPSNRDQRLSLLAESDERRAKQAPLLALVCNSEERP